MIIPLSLFPSKPVVLNPPNATNPLAEFLMLWWVPTIRLSLMLLHSCHFATAMNLCKYLCFLMVWGNPCERVLWCLPRDRDPQVETIVLKGLRLKKVSMPFHPGWVLSFRVKDMGDMFESSFHWHCASLGLCLFICQSERRVFGDLSGYRNTWQQDHILWNNNSDWAQKFRQIRKSSGPALPTSPSHSHWLFSSPQVQSRRG